jgi:exodeoxyribonuclease VII large subunit
VIAFGTVGLYVERGQYQFSVQRLMPRGLGAAEEALRRLKEKLLNLGYFKPERKRPLPKYPHRIAVITSGQGAAVRDILEMFVRRWPSHDVVVVSVRVQGAQAAGEVTAAVNQLNAIHRAGMPLDVIILGRGGGSGEDLAAFNDEALAHAIFRSEVPIISAVGHEIDFTIADLVADYRATTPTNAAEVATQYWALAHQLLADYANGMKSALAAKVVNARQRLAELQSRRPFRFPLQDIRNRQVRVDELFARLSNAGQRVIERKKSLTAQAAGKLNALSPLNVLTRGYSLTQKESGELLRDAGAVRVGDTIITRLQRGRVQSMVTEVPEIE